MKEKYSRTIGPVSSKVLLDLVENGKEIFTLDDACKIYSRGRQETTHFLRDLVKRGVLARIKSGVFIILKMGQENTQLSNWPIVAHFMVSPNNYYISHYGAMRLHGMTTHPLTAITVVMSKKRKAKKVLNIAYQFIYTTTENIWGRNEHWVTRHEKVWISDLERTILDGLERSELCGGIKEIVRGIWIKQKQIDWNKLIQYAENFRTKAAVKRLGFILEILNLGVKYLPELEAAIRNAKDYILLDPNEHKTGKYLKKWRIQANVNVDELRASIWG